MSFWTNFEPGLQAALATAETEVQSILQYMTPMVEAGARKKLPHAAFAGSSRPAPLVLFRCKKSSFRGHRLGRPPPSSRPSGKSAEFAIAETARPGSGERDCP